MSTPTLVDMRITGSLLIVGTVIFFAGASIPPLTPLGVRVWGATGQEFLELVAAHRRTWLWTNGLIIASVPPTVVGLGLLALILRDAGDRLLAPSGWMLFGLAAVLWLADLASRISATVWAAEETVRASAPPAEFEALALWISTLGFLYMVLAYLATIAYGGALLQTPLLPTWLGWTVAIVGLLGVVSVITRIPSILSIPAGVHLMPLLIGIFLLVER